MHGREWGINIILEINRLPEIQILNYKSKTLSFITKPHNQEEKNETWKLFLKNI